MAAVVLCALHEAAPVMRDALLEWDAAKSPFAIHMARRSARAALASAQGAP